MATTTIRVDKETHAVLAEAATESGESLMATVHEAAEALRRQRFAKGVRADFARLRADPEAWADYLAEAESTYVADGID